MATARLVQRPASRPLGDVLEREGLQDNAEKVGKPMKAKLAALERANPLVEPLASQLAESQ